MGNEFFNQDNGLRGNPKIKSADSSEFVTADILQERLTEMQRILEDPVYFAEKYFYIINLDNGKQLIKVYPKQADMIRSMCNYQRVVTLASRQSRKKHIIFNLRTLVRLVKSRKRNIDLRKQI